MVLEYHVRACVPWYHGTMVYAHVRTYVVRTYHGTYTCTITYFVSQLSDWKRAHTCVRTYHGTIYGTYHGTNWYTYTYPKTSRSGGDAGSSSYPSLHARMEIDIVVAIPVTVLEYVPVVHVY
jgi:hypothetical protein